MSQIFIQTQDRQLERMIQLLCSFNGINYSTEQSQADISIIDLDEGKYQILSGKKNIGISRYENQISESVQKKMDCIIHRPFNPDFLVNTILGIQDSNYSTKTINSTFNIQLADLQKAIIVDGKSIHLSLMEYRICQLLIQHRGEVVTYDMIRNTVKQPADSPTNLVNVTICHIRKKCENICGSQLIKTVQNKGYIIK